MSIQFGTLCKMIWLNDEATQKSLLKYFKISSLIILYIFVLYFFITFQYYLFTWINVSKPWSCKVDWGILYAHMACVWHMFKFWDFFLLLLPELTNYNISLTTTNNFNTFNDQGEKNLVSQTWSSLFIFPSQYEMWSIGCCLIWLSVTTL